MSDSDHDDFDDDSAAPVTAAPGRDLTLTVTPESVGPRVDKWLCLAVENLSRSRAKSLIEAGDVTVDGEVMTDPKRVLAAGAVLTIRMPEPEPAIPKPENLPLDILHEDAHLIVINKAAGMTVHPAAGAWNRTLVNALLYHCGDSLSGIGGVKRPGIVHRLDKETSGVMVVAKTDIAHMRLVETFQARDIDRAYLAATRGAPRPLSGTIDAPIARAPVDRKKMAVARSADAPGAKHAVTHYRGLQTFGETARGSGQPAAALIECRLETGRTHQIRVHMAHIGCPLIGDPVYARHKGVKAHGSGPAFNAAMATLSAFPRQALHARLLGFTHPVTGEPLSFEQPPPADLQALIDALKAL